MQLHTKSKAFSSDGNEYGSLPNTNVSPISLGHPGTLPRLNEMSLNYAIRLGLACQSKIANRVHFARKNYFYPDLPKGYQISQDDTPICEGGSIRIQVSGKYKEIPLIRIHMEEDSGKSMHDQDAYDSLIDLNRAGVPLLEVVTEPAVASSDEAYQYLMEMRKLVRYLDICDGNMEEGSMRCDANISVALEGAAEFGTRTEVKNMNSMRNVQRAIEFEIKRQIEVLENGGKIVQETRSFDATAGTTFAMRSKEMAHDYRYFPEPDLRPLTITEEEIKRVESALPPLPAALMRKYTQEFGLSEYDAAIITESKPIALYFEELVSNTKNYKAAANWLMGDIKSYMNQYAVGIDQFPISAKNVAAMIDMIQSGTISNAIASQKLFPAMLKDPAVSPDDLARDNAWAQNSDASAIADLVVAALEKYPNKVDEYRSGKTGILGLFVGEVMKLSKGTADPKTVNQLVREKLEEI